MCALIARLKAATEAAFTKYGHSQGRTCSAGQKAPPARVSGTGFWATTPLRESGPVVAFGLQIDAHLMCDDDVHTHTRTHAQTVSTDAVFRSLAMQNANGDGDCDCSSEW